MIGSLLLILAMFEGYFGYSLPDDLLSGIGLRAALSSITLGHPADRHLAALGAVRWRLPVRRRRIHSADGVCSPACTRCTSC